MLKKYMVSFTKHAFIYILILISVLSLCVGLNIGIRLDSIKKLEEKFTIGDYYILMPRFNTIRAKNEGEAERTSSDIKNSEEYRSFMGSADKVAEYYKALADVQDFYVFFLAHDFAIDIQASKLPRFPENYQMRYSYGQGMTRPPTDTFYDNLRASYDRGEDIYVQFCCFQIDYRIENTYYLPLMEGEPNDITIRYSDYVDTGTPIPVVVGYDLRDLFRLGDIIDASAIFALESDKIDEYYKDKTNSNIKIKIVGILAEGAYYLATSASTGTQPINTAIILPFFDFTAGAFENEIDRTVFINNYKNKISNLQLLTKRSFEEGEAEFLKVADQFGLGEVYSGIVVNSAYVVKGTSLKTYEKLTYTVFYASLVLLSVSLIFSVMASVNNKIKKLSVHFLVGADKGAFLWRIIIPFLAADVLACASANLLFWLFSPIISEKLGDFLLQYNIIAYASVSLCVAVGAFIFLVALIKINRTDFSKALKEAKV